MAARLGHNEGQNEGQVSGMEVSWGPLPPLST